MIVLVGAVFAEPTTIAQEANGNAYIDILATIIEASPRFQLAIKSGATATTSNDGIDAVDATDTAHDEVELSSTVAAALADGSADATVSFSINQTTGARTNANYSLTIKASDLELQTYSDGSAPTDELTSQEKFTVKTRTLALGSAGASIKGAVLTTVEMASVSVTTASDTTGAGCVLAVDYHGVVAATKELGVYTVVWNKNADAVSGTYKATVQLTVEAQ